MIKLFILSILLTAGCGACKIRKTEPINPVVTECVGSSEYFIRNESQFALSIRLVFSEGMGNRIDSSQTVNPHQSKLIAHDGSFGYIPRPVDTFSGLVLSTIADGRPVVTYRQDPIVNERWLKTKQNPSDPDYGCYSVTNTLVITDADLN